ncbi:MAG: 50S ribosomal protein L29 [Deltaproteobacteria bacterium]|nr:50S ribosomal protein L29 [Deltaproteobacteria bacterium]
MKDRENLSELGLGALREKERSLRESLFTLRMDHAANKLKDHRSIRRTRRELAKVLTFVNQKNKPA